MGVIALFGNFWSTFSNKNKNQEVFSGPAANRNIILHRILKPSIFIILSSFSSEKSSFLSPNSRYKLYILKWPEVSELPKKRREMRRKQRPMKKRRMKEKTRKAKERRKRKSNL